MSPPTSTLPIVATSNVWFRSAALTAAFAEYGARNVLTKTLVALGRVLSPGQNINNMVPDR